MKYKFALVVGRFQPYHNVHHKMVQHALGLADNVILILGSAKTAPDIRNPFTPQMREAMIQSCFHGEERKRLHFAAVRDYPYNENTWITEIQNIARTFQETLINEETEVLHKSSLADVKVCLVGHFKDESSYYLKSFPQWVFEPFFENTKEARTLNATDIRQMLFEGDRYEDLVPEPIKNVLDSFKKTQPYLELKKEYAYLTEYQKNSEFKGLPHKPTFVTTDAVVLSKGHILVVRRGANPGKGLLALPGGFLDTDLTLRDNMIKELKEETKIHVPRPIIESAIKDQKVFDYPKRSLRGRTVTHAFLLELNPSMEEGLPIVKGGDDADKAFWIPIAEFLERENEFFEDHASIVKAFIL